MLLKEVIAIFLEITKGSIRGHKEEHYTYTAI